MRGVSFGPVSSPEWRPRGSPSLRPAPSRVPEPPLLPKSGEWPPGTSPQTESEQFPSPPPCPFYFSLPLPRAPPRLLSCGRRGERERPPPDTGVHPWGNGRGCAVGRGQCCHVTVCVTPASGGARRGFGQAEPSLGDGSGTPRGVSSGHPSSLPAPLSPAAGSSVQETAAMDAGGRGRPPGTFPAPRIRGKPHCSRAPPQVRPLHLLPKRPLATVRGSEGASWNRGVGVGAFSGLP